MGVSRKPVEFGKRGRIDPLAIRRFLIENSGSDGTAGALGGSWQAPTVWTAAVLSRVFGVKVETVDVNLRKAWRMAPWDFDRVVVKDAPRAGGEGYQGHTTYWGSGLLARRDSRPAGMLDFAVQVGHMSASMRLVVTCKQLANESHSESLRCASWDGKVVYFGKAVSEISNGFTTMY